MTRDAAIGSMQNDEDEFRAIVEKMMGPYLPAPAMRNIIDQVDSKRWSSGPSLSETREIHIQGIKDKVSNLELELDRQQSAWDRVSDDADYMDQQFPGEGQAVMSMSGDPILPQISGIRDKLDMLYKQLEQLESAAGGPVGPLYKDLEY